MTDEIKGYLDALIPPNLPKQRRKELYDELYCHLLDRADRYEEIGWSKEESIQKAVEDVGTDQAVNQSISSEFEKLYHERTWWALIPAAVIMLMNIFCLPLDTWVASADYNDEPTPAKALVSFVMIFICAGFIFFARAKRYRKMLVGAAVANLIVGGFVYWCFYPQAALYAIENVSYLLIDSFTPFVIPQYAEPWLFLFASIAGTVRSAIYCILAAILIKKDKARPVKNPRKKAVVSGVCFAAVTVCSCVLLPRAMAFTRDYPLWFDWYVCSTEESEALFSEIELNAPYADAAVILAEKGWHEISEYGNSLNKNERKKYYSQYRGFNFGDEYKVWFLPENHSGGNGFIFLKADETGKIISKGTGNLHPLEFDKYGYLRYSPSNREYDDMQKVTADFDSLKKGEAEIAVMNRFGAEYGKVYSRFESVIGEKYVDRFTVYARGVTNPDAQSYERTGECHIELTFSGGILSDGRMLKSEYSDGKQVWIESSLGK
ncbi:MAG: hypothetical protein K6G71_02565 [Clostridiales bacterium]|nr:hypothetical protein [Clostridiales bacterium]